MHTRIELQNTQNKNCKNRKKNRSIHNRSCGLQRSSSQLTERCFQPDLTDIYKTLYPKALSFILFSVHMEHSPS